MKIRASKRHLPINYPKKARDVKRTNVAYDMLRIVKWTCDAKDDNWSAVFSPHSRPIVAVVFSCAAIEGFVNFVGGKIDSDWLTFSRGMSEGSRRKPGIRDKIARIYEKRDLKIDFGAVPYSEVLALFKNRGFLMHPTLDVREFEGEAPPADILELVSDEFPPARAKALATAVIEKLLSDTGVRLETQSLHYREIH